MRQVPAAHTAQRSEGLRNAPDVRTEPATMNKREMAVAVALLIMLAGVDAMVLPCSKVDFVKANYKRVLELQKRGPQPRAVEVTHMLKDVKPSEYVIPRQTVLHRCDEVLCCGLRMNPQNFECRPAVENVTLYFHAAEMGSTRYRRIEHEFQNHTKCDCVRNADER